MITEATAAGVQNIGRIWHDPTGVIKWARANINYHTEQRISQIEPD